MELENPGCQNKQPHVHPVKVFIFHLGLQDNITHVFV